jgi:tetratricopeptide (TPR) repeat protein
MKLRVAALALVVAALGAFVAFQRAADDGSTIERSATASRRSSTAAELQIAEQTVRDRPEDASALTRLGSLYLQRARETADPSYYALADQALTRAQTIAPEDVSVLVASGTLALARHDFEGALALGERARAINAEVNAVYAVITDALVELGRYDEALATAQEMVDRRPDFASLSRVSYLRELHGDLGGAIEAMEQAAASAPSAYDQTWALVIVGNLELQRADVDAAQQAYDRAGLAMPDDAMVLAARARLAVTRGDLTQAEDLLRVAVLQRPMPEYAIALGELLEWLGRTAEAEEQYTLVRATQQLFAVRGVDTDIELALFDADHGDDPARTLETALAAYGRRPSTFAADTVAWAAYRAGSLEDAARFSREALRLGTRDPRLLYHAGVIAEASGDRDSALSLLRDAVAMEAAQSVAYASAARAALSRISSEASR